VVRRMSELGLVDEVRHLEPTKQTVIPSRALAARGVY